MSPQPSNRSTRITLGAGVLALLVGAPDASAQQGGVPVNGFPNWNERVIHEWINRARCEPEVEMSACGANCAEGDCYTPKPPLAWNLNLNRSARFHSDEMKLQSFFAHDSRCTVSPTIAATYPTTCSGAASCACVGGTSNCNPTCTTFAQRVTLFGGVPSGEIIASHSSGDPVNLFYLWLYEPSATTACSFTSANGHRWLILNSTSGGVGIGTSGNLATGDFGSSPTPTKIVSGSHHPRQASSVQAWANWYDTSGPSQAVVNVDGVDHALTLQRGTEQNGAWSATITGVGTGCHRYYFAFRDAGGTLSRWPSTGTLGIGPSSSCPDWEPSGSLAAQALCFGDGTAGPCPCGNQGASGRGCANSQNASGALLAATGTTIPDTVVLTSSGELASATTIFLQGNALGPATAFGDGLRCTGGSLKRLATKTASGGTTSYPMAGDPPISVRSAALGDPITPGTSRWYQAYYRDPSPTFCPPPQGDTWNVTNGLRITW